MRRSKSDPAKYARNYRKISQRRMTQYDHIDEEKEMERLRRVLRDSEKHLQRAQADEDETAGVTSSSLAGASDKRKRKYSGENDTEAKNSILSEELQAEAFGDGEENPFIVLPSKKKKKKPKSRIELTPEEIREAKALQKKTARKLQQLEKRAAQKRHRAEIYKKLEQHKISSQALGLLSRSGKISRRDVDTKKEVLQKLVKKERAGLELSAKEKDILYPSVEIDEIEMPSTGDQESGSSNEGDLSEIGDVQKERDGKQRQITPSTAVYPEPVIQDKDENTESEPSDDESENENNEAQTKSESNITGLDFAAQMMASLTKLKKDTDEKAAEKSSKHSEEDEGMHVETSGKKYVPSEPTQLKTAAALGLKVEKRSSTRKVMPIQRPPSIENARFDLPVSAMEFEIMDAIRNNDVTIICGETGSGKSTQVPQYIYESGMCLNQSNPGHNFLVGVTQPRRVAAVSTAKRVCYEMGAGDGQSIKSTKGKGNLVSYRTRYETAGSGEATRVQFMTDGILLQEIQMDLLLRRYSVIVLDESHERNLNTDVLIGLLSVALPLRKKAAQEDPSLVPLKLVLMSATLRVEDFTKNTKLFPSGVPAVVNVPGRTHPVTIHHSKVTEMDDYESVAFKKVCKIHRNLPQGAILLFLTGKGEIIRMVNKLRRALNPSSGQKRFRGTSDVNEKSQLYDDLGPREMDDDELDAEDGVTDDYDDMEDDVVAQQLAREEGEDANIPKKAYILPLYSLLSAEEQAKVFAPVPEDHRLIVVATNIAETSITIPGVSYVVDTGRQKCRNYNSGTGVASFDVMWISRAAADQRAGRAGRTGAGHCYRLYSSSLYSRHLDAFALPEVLTRPLEDVVLAMKALKISNVSDFPFPTPPDKKQIDAAVTLLANIGCIDVSNVERDGGDGVATRLGEAVAKLPLGVRYGKMLLVAAQAGVLDYAIVIVSVLSENSPFQRSVSNESDETNDDDDDQSLDEVDKARLAELKSGEKAKKRKWQHRSGDILAAMLAVGAYTYAGQGAGGASEQLAGRKFCEENGLNYVIMGRIQKMRKHLAHLASVRLSTASGIAAKTGGYSCKMAPPTKVQERLLVQSICSGLLDNVALLAPPSSISGEHPYGLRSAYLAASSSTRDPLFMDRNSTMFTRDFRQLPQWICYDSVLRKVLKDGTPVRVMKNITPLDSTWLGELAKGTKLLSVGGPLVSPPPSFDAEKDAVLCAVSSKFGVHGWEIPPVRSVMFDSLQTQEGKHSAEFLRDDSFRWFARFLLEGKVLPELEGISDLLSDRPMVITKRTPAAKVSLLIAALAGAGIDSAAALRKHWAEKDDKFLFKNLKAWIKKDKQADAKKIWIEAVKKNIAIWKSEKNGSGSKAD